jgi:hypothetical protein
MGCGGGATAAALGCGGGATTALTAITTMAT